MFDFTQDFVLFSYNFKIDFLMLKFCHVWCRQKNDIGFLKIFYWKNILFKSPYYEKGKQRKKKGIPPFPTQEITLLKK
jgi:hypothetical protein